MEKITTAKKVALNLDVIRNLQSADSALVYSEILNYNRHFITPRVLTLEDLVERTGLGTTQIMLAMTRLVVDECIAIEPSMDPGKMVVFLKQKGLMKAYAIQKLNSSSQEVRRYRKEVKDKSGMDI
jgi:hypothetical protein